MSPPSYFFRDGDYMDTNVTSPAFISASQAGRGSGVSVAALIITIAYNPDNLGQNDNNNDGVTASVLRDGTSISESLFDLPLWDVDQWQSLDSQDGESDNRIVLQHAVDPDTRYRVRVRAYDYDLNPTYFGGFGILEISATNGKLAPSVLAGDYNRNNIVDAADYTVWRNNFGAAAGTLSNDVDGGAIGTKQYQTWKKNFGTALGAGSFNLPVVPEPAAFNALVSLAIFCWPRCRSTRRQI